MKPKVRATRRPAWLAWGEWPAGRDFVRDGRSMPPALTDHTTCPGLHGADILLNVHKTPSWATSRKEGMAWFSGRPMTSLWSPPLHTDKPPPEIPHPVLISVCWKARERQIITRDGSCSSWMFHLFNGSWLKKRFSLVPPKSPPAALAHQNRACVLLGTYWTLALLTLKLQDFMNIKNDRR